MFHKQKIIKNEKKEFYKIKTTLLHVHVVKTIPS